MDLATIIVLILGIIVLVPIYLVIRVLRRNFKNNRAQALKKKYDSRVLEAVSASMHLMGFIKAVNRNSYLHTYEKRDSGGRHNVNMRVNMRVTPTGYSPRYTLDVHRQARADTPAFRDRAEWTPKPSRGAIDLQLLHGMIAKAKDKVQAGSGS